MPVTEAIDLIERQQSDGSINLPRQSLGAPANNSRLQLDRSLRKTLGNETVISVVRAVENEMGNRVSGLEVSIEGDSVVVSATVPSFYARQLFEYKARAIVVEVFGLKFLPRVVVEESN